MTVMPGSPEDPFAAQRREEARQARNREIERSQPPEDQDTGPDIGGSLRQHVTAEKVHIRQFPDPAIYYVHNSTGHIVKTYMPSFTAREEARAHAQRIYGIVSWSYLSEDFRPGGFSS